MRLGARRTPKGDRGLVILLAIALLLSNLLCNGRVSAAATSVEELEQQQEQAKQAGADLAIQQEQAKKDAEALKQAKKRLSDSLGEMDLQVVAVSNAIADIEEAMLQTQYRIEETKQALEESLLASEKQYQDMKLRIQFMYENSGALSWTDIFQADSFVEALNRVEYAMELAQTDRRLLQEYQDTLQMIATQKEALEREQEEQLAQQKELEEQKKTLISSIKEKKSEIAQAQTAIADKEKAIEKYAEQIAAMEEYEQKLEEEKQKKIEEELARIKAEQEAKRKAEEERKRKEEEERRKEEERRQQEALRQEGENQQGEAQPSDAVADSIGNLPEAVPAISVTPEEEELFAALVYCEAGGESYEAQLAVASVVVNRIHASIYPDNLLDVIYQRGQFSPAASGRLALTLENGLTTDSCRRAAREALQGNISGEWMYFCYNNGLRDGTVIGKQLFF